MRTLLLAPCALLLAACMTRGGAAPVAAAAGSPDLEKRVAALVPTPDEERWLKVPWRTNIVEAVAEAKRAGKPVMLWVMNGNPLGCA
jgi:ABC-type sugar transport system substrate-binding protein